MNRDDIIRMAIEAGLHIVTDEQVIEWAREAGVDNSWDINWFDPYYARFAKLVAAAEREACAKVAEERWLDKANCTAEEMYEMQKKNIAAAIRARGLQELNKAAEANGEEL